MPIQFAAYRVALGNVLERTEATDSEGGALSIDAALTWVMDTACLAHTGGQKVIFVGNGGSAAIASHMAIDWSKNGGVRSLAFNDGAALTCAANDFGYEHVFAKQIDWHAAPGDLLVAISSSGRSANILNAAEAGRKKGCQVLTLSGFGSDNPLRRLGDVNLYVPSAVYGAVELSHQILLHAVVDACMANQTTECATAE